MLHICFYFQVHQPYRLRTYQFFDIGNCNNYFDEQKNAAILQKVAHKCYLPMNALLLKLLKKYPAFKISFSFSGVVLDQFQHYAPEVLESFAKLVATGQVELLAETYYHSLSFLYSREEFIEQVQLHKNKIQQLFDVQPTILRNTELIYSNEIASVAQKLGYKGILAEGADKILGWRSPNFVYKPINTNISLLLKNYRLSDDIAFRFSEKSWHEYPLNVEKYTQWINAVHGNGTHVNLFMDYETFGEHQWKESGIFDFMEQLPGQLLQHPDNTFSFPSEIIDLYNPVAELDIPFYVSWADVQRDVSAWLGNNMQCGAIEKLYALETAVKKTNNNTLIEKWRKLQTSDHFYYMCTKWFNDGDVHKYFNPYDSPYDGFIYFMNAYKDLQHNIEQSKNLRKHIHIQNNRN